jgi:surface antigen
MANAKDAGQDWITAATNAGLQCNDVPSANSIAVWSGHVPYVEVDPTTKGFVLNEANCRTNKRFADKYDPVNPENTQSPPNTWGGGYDGKPEPLSTVMTILANAKETFLGYIHLS